MEDLKQVVDALSHITFGLVLIATVVVKITPTDADDEKLALFLKKIHSFMSLFPTIGRNPMTKLLLEKAKAEEVIELPRQAEPKDDAKA